MEDIIWKTRSGQYVCSLLLRYRCFPALSADRSRKYICVHTHLYLLSCLYVYMMYKHLEFSLILPFLIQHSRIYLSLLPFDLFSDREIQLPFFSVYLFMQSAPLYVTNFLTTKARHGLGLPAWHLQSAPLALAPAPGPVHNSSWASQLPLCLEKIWNDAFYVF